MRSVRDLLAAQSFLPRVCLSRTRRTARHNTNHPSSARRVVGDTRFHWGFGPIYRAMFQTVTDAQRNRRVWNTEDDLYDAQTVGVRFSLYSRPDNPGSASGWTPTAYVDFTGGLFQNFVLVSGKSDAAQECLRRPSACLATGTPPTEEFDLDKRWRTYIEGRVFIRSIYMGFDLNNGRGPDDVRFVAGFTLDLSRFFADSK